MGWLDSAQWWEMRRASTRNPRTHRCPLCGGLVPAFGEHAILIPEGDMGRRRHAHFHCVAEARRAGRLPSRDERKRGG